MDRWKITIEAWPFSVGGAVPDQAAAGDRAKDYVVRAEDAAEAMRLAEAIAMGVRANPAVWRAPITGVIKEALS